MRQGWSISVSLRAPNNEAHQGHSSCTRGKKEVRIRRATELNSAELADAIYDNLADAVRALDIEVHHM